MDRALVPFLMEPIRKEFTLSDTQLGFLAGPALAVLYTILGIPIARWADRSNRVNTMFASIALWSAIVVSFAVVKSFWELAAAQVGVGIGEAGFTAIAISVIADYHRKTAARARALSMPAFLVRRWGIGTGEMGLWYAVIFGGGGGGAIWLSGRLTGQSGHSIAQPTRSIAVATALVPPTMVLSLWSSWKYLSLAAFILCQALVFFFLAPTLALVQQLCSQNARATMASLFILTEVLAGSVLGVQLVGALSDALTVTLGNDSQALQWSMTAISMLAVWAAAHFWIAGRTPREL